MSRARFGFVALAFALFLAAVAAGCSKKTAGGGGPSAAPPESPKHEGKKKSGETATGETGERGPAGEPGAPGGPRPLPGYERRVEPLKGVDVSALRGRRIAIDPGHGGRFPGSLGVNGLTEAEVNLGVALHLWGLLTDAGAVVTLTRTADTDFTTATDSTLRGDLERRTLKANSFDADVFLSIHHNADAGGRHDRNETQTYFKLADPRASVDLANSIHAHLKTNLGIAVDRLMPGNYYVLRNSASPAVLGESSYLTNPDVESRLALAAKQRLEAEAYFLGLAEYFRRGVPRIVATRVVPAMDAVATGGDPRDASDRPYVVAAVDRDPSTVELYVDGAAVDSAQIVRRPGGELRWRPAEAFTDGRHVAQWTVRAPGGNWSRTIADTFDVDQAVAKVAFEVQPKSGLAPGQVAALTFSALDRHGRPVADTLGVRFSTRVGAVVVDSLAPRVRQPGVARGYARVMGGSLAAFDAAVMRPSLGIENQNREVTATLSPAASVTTGFVRTPDGVPVDSAVVVADSASDANLALGAVTNADGWYALSSTGLALRATAPGYASSATTGVGPAADLRLLPIAGGALIGKRIAIDPMGDDSDTTAVFSDSTFARAQPDSAARLRRAVYESDANLRVARALRQYLEAAGARVVMTRDSPESLSALDRLRRVEAFAPDRVIVLGRKGGTNGATMGHYFSSPGGKALAGRIQTRYRTRSVVGVTRVIESADWVVQQTGAVAVLVHGPNPEPLYSDATRGARQLRNEAYAIYLALAEDLGADPKAFQTVKVRVAHGTAPEGNVPVLLDRGWSLLSDDQGEVVFDGLPSGARFDVRAGDMAMTVRARVTTPAKDPVVIDLGPAVGAAP